MAIKDIAGVGLTAGRTTQQQGHLTISLGLLGEVVVDHQGGLALVHERFGQGRAGVWSKVLKGCGLGGTRSYHDGVIESSLLPQHLNNVGHGCGLLSDGHINADDVFALLVDDRVDGNSGFARLTVANNQLTLAPANRNHGVDGGDARLHGLVHRLALDDARRHRFDQAGFGSGDFTLTVNWLAQ